MGNYKLSLHNEASKTYSKAFFPQNNLSLAGSMRGEQRRWLMNPRYVMPRENSLILWNE